MLQFVFKKMLNIGLIVHLYTISVAEAILEDTKIWNPTTNFLNPRNWDGGQLPCANDRIIFPDSSPVITMMPESLTVGGLVLPVNGEILFPEKAAIELTGGTSGGTCSGKDVHFRATVDYWYDPINWNITSDRAFPRIPNRRNLAAPHAFQVPCPTDKVEFPEKTTFRTHVLYPVTKVAFMEINGVSYSQKDFNDLLRTHVGSLLFPDNPWIRITSASCTDETGCICGNDGPNVLPTICNQVTPYCPELECSDPITPVGSCCPICGAQLKFKYSSNFRLASVQNLHIHFLSREEFRDVESFMAKTHKGEIQCIYVDSSKYKGVANEVAQGIYNILTGDGMPYYVRSVKILKSEAWKSGVPSYDQYTGMSSGGVAGLVIVILVVLGLGAAFFVYKKRHIPGFNFARFDLRGDKIELELGTTPHDELEPVDPPSASPSAPEEASKGFDNPVYGTAVEEVSPVLEFPETKNFVENPMFMIFDESENEEKK